MARSATFPQAREAQTGPSHGGAYFPPIDRFGGDDWSSQPQGHRGPRDRLRRYRIGLGFALVSIVVFFVALTAAYLLRKNGGAVDVITGQKIRGWTPIVLPPILWLNTVILLLSSLSMDAARRLAFREPDATEAWLGLQGSRRSSLLWLSVTLVLGGAFLFGQVIAWTQLQSASVFALRNPSGQFFLLLTGAHAAHLMGGMFALLWATVSNLLERPLASRQIAVDVTTWYWHAMGVLWICVFLLLRFAA
jgi:cytochrome c oxidase subunit 3